jgi:GTPase SAR1 family protein
MKTIELEGKVIKLLIWDTAGKERFRAIPLIYKKELGVLFNRVGLCMEEIKKHAASDV